MATEIEYVNYKDFVAGLETTENPGVDDVTVVSSETDGPRSTPSNISSLTNSATAADLVAGNYIPLQTSRRKKKLDAETLLQATAQNALAGNVAPAFDASKNYVARNVVEYGGKIYYFTEDKNPGVWDSSVVKEVSISEILENILPFYKQDEHALANDNTLSSNIYSPWPTYYKVFVPKGGVVKYEKTTGAALSSGYAYLYIVDMDGNDLYKLLGGVDSSTFNVSYTMPVDGYVSICGSSIYYCKFSISFKGVYEFLGDYSRYFGNYLENKIRNSTENVLLYYEQNIHVLKDDNTLSDLSYSPWPTYYKVFVPKGGVVKYEKTTGAALSSGYAYLYIVDMDGNDLYKLLGGVDSSTFNVSYTMPVDGYVSICGAESSVNIMSINVNIQYNYSAMLVKGLLSNVSEYGVIKADVENLTDVVNCGEEFAAIRKFGVIGDSLSVGYMTSSAGEVNRRNIPYSWGQVLARKNGQVCLNFGKSGIKTTTWWTDPVCKDLLVLPENQCQAYIVGIGTNDVIDSSFPIGSMSDIDWSDYNNNGNSFYGHFARILQLILSVAPNAIIFVLTLPYPRVDSAKNTAFRTICADAHLSSNAFLVDLEANYNDLFKTIGNRYAYAWHFTAAGYASIATALGVIVSETIRQNSSVDAIKDIGFIPFGSNDVIE